MINSNSTGFAVVFGGSGFIGNFLVEELMDKGYEVLNADLIESENSRAGFIKCDVRRPISIALDRRPDMVFVLAATHRSPGHKNHEYFDTNVGGAENIVSWCKQAGIPRIIFTSSISVYGPGLDLKSEESIPNPSSAYGKSKLQSEKIFSAWQEDDSESRSLVICRPSVIFGPGEKGNFTRLANALKKGYFVIPSRNETIKACGYVKDLVRSLVFTSNLSQSRTLIYNFAFPEEYSVREICLSFKKVAGFRQPITIPVEVLLPALRLLPFGLNFIAIRATKLIESTRISSAKIEKLGFVWNYDLESSLKDWLENSRLPGGFA